MKINSISFKNEVREWEFDEISFDDLTLLVGISGVGKTQILRSIVDLMRIANGYNANGIKWKIHFQSVENIDFIWEGQFENNRSPDDIILWDDEEDEKVKKQGSKILFEKLYRNNLQIIDRDTERILFDNKVMPKLDSNESILKILKEEEFVRPAYESFNRIIFRDHTISESETRFFRGQNFFEKALKKYNTLTDLRNSNLDTNDKLFLVQTISPETFDEIKERFIDVFQQVENLKVEPVKENIPFEVNLVQIKERGVKNWILQDRISSGMLRTLKHISEMFLWADGTLILIDEFENSLGLNCIDVLSRDLLTESRRIQFIATSHHPYVINHIPPTNWKLVTREGGHIRVYDTAKFHLEKSSHDNFIKLINLKEYREGISIK